LISASELSALFQVIVVDVVLAGDNAIVVGMVAASLPREQRARVIVLGIAAATVLRILFAAVTTQLLQILGLLLAGGVLLLWVCWKLWRELRQQRRIADAVEELEHPQARTRTAQPVKSMREAAVQIVLADVSMSLDNVLAVAGVARHHTWVLVAGLILSVALMGAAATVIAALLKRFPWIAYIGLAIIFYVACAMIYDGAAELFEAVNDGAASVS
jgi:YjbE family integral membrane protein